MGNRTLKADKLHDVLACRLHGKSIRQTADLTGVSRNTIAKWANAQMVEAVRRLRPQCVPLIEPPAQKILESEESGAA